MEKEDTLHMDEDEDLETGKSTNQFERVKSSSSKVEIYRRKKETIPPIKRSLALVLASMQGNRNEYFISLTISFSTSFTNTSYNYYTRYWGCY